jgi:hypothetical protein
MKKPKKQLTEAEMAKLDKEIQQGWVIINKMKELLKIKGYDKSSRTSK